MRLITFVLQDEVRERPGALKGDGSVVDLSTRFEDMLTLIEAGEDGLDQAREILERSDRSQTYSKSNYSYRAPIPKPPQIRDFANYEKHVLQAMDASMHLRSLTEPDPEAARERYKASGQYVIAPVWYEQPIYFKCNRLSVIGHEQDVIWPNYSERMDYELELACVIGKTTKNVSRDAAREHIFGYTIFNDFSARDALSKEMAFRMGPAKGKDFDTGNVFGPCIITRDEIDDPYRLKMSVRVNGETKIETTSSGSQHDFERCIEHVSMDETLHPGEILALGTVDDGCGFESLTWLSESDVVELEVEKIGILRNRLVRPSTK
ncbi:MAG: fumarylacetoacetate hydrolase family protein [Henriciella sp.]